MTKLKSHLRKVYEYQLGYAMGLQTSKEVRSEQWGEVQRVLEREKIPLTVNNLRFIAQIKAKCPRHNFETRAMERAIAVAAELGEKATGEEIKNKVISTHPRLKNNRFYWVFRSRGYPFRKESEYEISLLGEVLYMLFIERNCDAR